MRRPLDNLTLENVCARAASWLHERVDLRPLGAWMAKKTVPAHRHSWIYLLGGAALFLGGMQVLSGSLLMLYYQPTEAAAYESVRRIVTEVPYGWLVRSIHFWGANLFIGTVILHFLSVLLTRAYRKPRELTWISGVLMLLLALAFGFSGYLLPWNELAYYATLVGTRIPGVLPGVGDFVTHFLRGGEQVSGDTITRFYAAHVMILPVTFGLLLSIHLILIQVQGMSLPLGTARNEVRDDRPFFSEFVWFDICVWLMLFGTLVTLSVFLPAELGTKADFLKPAPEGIKPEWYFLFMFKTLKHVPETVGVAFFALVALFLLVVPFLDRKAVHGQRSPALTAVFLAFLAYAVVFEFLAWLTPGANYPPEELRADTYSIPASAVSVALLWSLIGFLVFYLRRLAQENARVRRLYTGDRGARL